MKGILSDPCFQSPDRNQFMGSECVSRNSSAVQSAFASSMDRSRHRSSGRGKNVDSHTNTPGRDGAHVPKRCVRGCDSQAEIHSRAIVRSWRANASRAFRSQSWNAILWRVWCCRRFAKMRRKMLRMPRSSSSTMWLRRSQQFAALIVLHSWGWSDLPAFPRAVTALEHDFLKDNQRKT